MTDEERIIHEEAVRLRKMTDQQLYEAFQNASRGAGLLETEKPTNYSIDNLQKLLTGLLNGE
jgi:hypothetical protein